MVMESLARSRQDYGKILPRLANNLPWIMARVPWLRTLGNDFLFGKQKNDDIYWNFIGSERTNNSLEMYVQLNICQTNINRTSLANIIQQ